MDLVVEPDFYVPNIDESGRYVDKVPSFLKKGIQCHCGSRKEKLYETKQKFKEHIKTKAHQLWLDDLNINRSNHLIESTQLKETVKNQQIIIAQLTRQLDIKIKEYEALQQKPMIDSTIDLLSFD